jgi:inosose dehydratase
MEVKLAKAPIAWTNDDLPQLGGDTPVETCLSEIRVAGFVGTELGGKYPKDKKELKQLLNRFDLELAGGWFSGFLLENSVKKEIARLEEEIERRAYVGCNIIVYCECSNTIQGDQNKPLSQKPVLTDKQMKEYALRFSQLASYAKEKGVILGYHHHMGTIIQTPEEIDKFLEYSTNDVGLTYDTGHIYFGGGNPLDVIKKHKNRIFHVHFKDVREDVRLNVQKEDKSFLDAVLDGVYTVPGDGIIDFEPIVEVLKEIDYKGWIVVEAEQDPAKANPLEYAKKAHSYLSNLI